MKVTKKEELSRPQEHVFLVNCIGSSDAQSEAAYYSSAPIADPDTVAVVTTASEGLKHWEDSTTTTAFVNAGSSDQTGFTVTLGPRPNIGDIAGNASNTWDTSFACYAQASTFLYTREDRECSSVYDCSHADRVSESVSPTPMSTSTPLESIPPESTPLESTPTIPTTSLSEIETTTKINHIISRSTTTRLGPSSIQTSASSMHAGTTQIPVTSATDSPPPHSPPHSTEPRVGTAIGIAIGVTLGTILVAVTTISLLRRYWSWRRPDKSKSSNTASSTELSGVDGSGIYEASGREIPVELAGSYLHVHELEARPRRERRVGAGSLDW